MHRQTAFGLISDGMGSTFSCWQTLLLSLLCFSDVRFSSTTGQYCGSDLLTDNFCKQTLHQEMGFSIAPFAQSVVVNAELYKLPPLAWNPVAQLRQPHTFDVHFLVCPVPCNLQFLLSSHILFYTLAFW